MAVKIFAFLASSQLLQLVSHVTSRVPPLLADREDEQALLKGTWQENSLSRCKQQSSGFVIRNRFVACFGQQKLTEAVGWECQ
jgi:hypothetical protein